MDISFQTLDVTSAQRDLAAVHQRIVKETGRVELIRDGSADCCVIISKAELEGLEHALEILSNTEAVRSMHATLTQLVTLYTKYENDEGEVPALADVKMRLMTAAQQ